MTKLAAKRKPESVPIPVDSQYNKKPRITQSLTRPAPYRDYDVEYGQEDDYASQSVFIDELPGHRAVGMCGGQKMGLHVRSRNGNARGPAKEQWGKVPVVELMSDEYNEDPGRMESQDFLRLVETEAKKKKKAARVADEYQRQFTEKVVQEGKELERRLQELEAESNLRDASFISAFAKAYQVSAPYHPSKATFKSGSMKGIDPEENIPHFSALCVRSQNLIERAFKIVQSFDDATRMIERFATSKLLENEWAKENELASNILKIGVEVGVERHRQIVEGKRIERAEEGLEVGLGERGMDVGRRQVERLLFHEGKGGVGHDAEELRGYEAVGWGKLARRQERVVKRLVKGLGKRVEV